MSIQHVLSVVAVRDIATSRAWYEKLFGRVPDNNPMDNLVEWRVTDDGWVQVAVDVERAGHSQVNLAVDDLNAQLDELRGRGLSPDPVVQANKGVQLSGLSDPDGNQIGLVGGFREVY